MHFQLSNSSLKHKVSLLIAGITLAVSLAVGGIGELILHRASSTPAKQPSGIASLERMIGQGDAVMSSVTGADGIVVGVVVMRSDAGPAVLPAAFDGRGLAINAADQVAVAAPADEPQGAPRVLLLVAGLVVFAAAAVVGTQIAGGMFEPLGQLEKEVELLAKGDTGITISAQERSDEVGRIARAMARIQQSLVEFERLKAELAARGSALVPEKVDVVSNLTNVLGDLFRAVGNAFRLLWAECKVVGRQWNQWWHDGLGVPRRA